jgi:hypothetical protein
MSEAYSRLTHDTMQAGITRRGTSVFVNNANYVAGLGDRLIEVVLLNNGNNLITLPPVSQAAGMFMTIRLVSTGGDLLVVDDNADDDWWVTATLGTNMDVLFLYSDGRHWIDVGCSCGIAGIL